MKLLCLISAFAGKAGYVFVQSGPVYVDKDLPQPYPPYQTCHRWFQKWCQQGMRVVAFIEEMDVIRKILKHLGLWDDKRRPVPKHYELDIAQHGRLGFFIRTRMKSLIHILCTWGHRNHNSQGGNDLR